VEQREMKADVELFREILDDEGHGLNVKSVAHLTRLSRDTIYAYQLGRINIPITVWSQLFEQTRDLRIVTMLAGSVPMEFFSRDLMPDLTDDAGSLRGALQSMKDFHQMQAELAEIVADGRIDQSDAESVRKYNRHFVQHMAHSHAVHRAINTNYQRSIQDAEHGRGTR
jgi:hypothetical protein